MKKKFWLVFGLVVVALVGLMVVLLLNRRSSELENSGNVGSNYANYELGVIKELAEVIDYEKLDINAVVPAGEVNGNIPENIKGNSDAPLLVFEYADYQCSACAHANPEITKLIESYDGKVALVFRTYILPYHSNGVMAAAAANAAALQGYWSEYKDLLFANQNDWFSSTGSTLQGQLEDYFVQVVGDRGDLERFRQDMASEAVAQKIAFDYGAGQKMDLGGTPWFYIDGEWIENGHVASVLKAKIDEKLKEVKQ